MDNYSNELYDALVKQHKEIFDYQSHQLKDKYSEYIKCPVCDSDNYNIKYKKDWFVFSECKKCGFTYLNPRLNEKGTYSFYDSEWNQIYNRRKFYAENDTTKTDEKRNIENLKLIQSKGAKKGKLLEIGIGNGFFLKTAQDAGYEVTGVELNPKNCEVARELLKGNGVICNKDLYSVQFGSDMFDVIYMKDVFEHVPDPMKMLSELNRIAKKGCILFIEVPNIDGWIYKIVKERHVCIFAFEHLNYWSESTLRNALSKNSFIINNVSYESDDFTLQTIIGYFIDPAFTSVNGKKSTGLKRFILRTIRKIVSLPPISYFENIIKKIPDNLWAGSQIKVLAVKQ